MDILTVPGAGAKSSLSARAGGTSGPCFQTPRSLWWEIPCQTELWICQQQIKRKKFNPCQMWAVRKTQRRTEERCDVLEPWMWPRFPHSHLLPQLRQTGCHPSTFSLFPSSYVIESVWLKLNNTQAAVAVMKQSNCTSVLSPSLVPLSLLLVHFSLVWAQGSWSRAMLSQQQRDADGRAVQSGINALCRAFHTWGREGKEHQSKRGRSLADNEKPCSVSCTGKLEGVRKKNEWGQTRRRGKNLKEKTKAQSACKIFWLKKKKRF